MSGTHGVLQPNQPGYFYITLEESYVALFKSSAEKWLKEHKDEEDAEKLAAARAAHAVAKAYITDVLVHLSNDLYSRTHSEKNLWVFLSFPQLETRLHGGCKMRTLKDAMKEMIEDAYVFKQPNRDPRYKSLEYRLNLPKYRRELIELPKKVDKEDSANLHDETEENDSSQNDSANTHDDSANLHDHDAKMHDDSAELHAIHNIDITNTEHTHKEESITSTSQNSNTSPNGDTLSLFQEITNRFGGVEQVRSLLEKLSASSTQDNAKNNEQAIEHPIASKTTQPSLLPDEPPQQPASNKGKNNRGRKPKQVEVEVPELTEEEKTLLQKQIEEAKAKEEERLAKHRDIYACIVKRRTRELTGGKVAMERKYVNMLIADGFTTERTDNIHEYLATKHWRWSQIENKYNITAQTIYEEAGSVEAILNDLEYQKNSQGNAKSNQPPKIRQLLPVSQQQTNSNIIKGSGSITDLRQLSQRAAAMRGAN